MRDNKENQQEQVMPKLDITILAKIKSFQEDFGIQEIEEIVEIFKDHFCIFNNLDTDGRQAAIDILNKMKEICTGILISV